MSSQQDPGMDLGISRDQQSLRLLELPPKLLETLIHQKPKLRLKSTAVDFKTGQADPNIVLCTDHQTYQVRQVHSSNSCFVIKSAQAQQVPENTISHGSSISAVAQCTATLELAPYSGSVQAYIRRTLPIYATREHDEIPEGVRKSVFVDDAPFSEYELHEACTKVCAFEYQNMMWRPDASMLLHIWRSITSAATLKGIDIVKPFAKASLTQLMEEDGFPASLLNAVLARVAPQNVNLKEDFFVLDRVLCIPWIGKVLLESCSQSRTSVNIANFLGDWRELLPESWRGLAKLEMLNNKYCQISDTTIAFDEASSTEQPKSGASSVAGGRSSRKWHERFRAERNGTK